MESKPYVVVARRYRPQTFADLIGQEHVAKALSNAIETGRVGHAYLFTGARGVGKTSSARILAKALNCVHGPTPTPCNQCDICQSISSGEDVDVLEIDGASNRGIDEIRQLRQNAGVRPSRARYKIYIIDEVHMLTREAFNALLKTLEEPPEHVKFIFCTTEATKIPITILSRCQRFDFAGILTSSIQQRLQQIVDAEGVEAEPEALEVLARRAAGSMRDSQSLLEQLLAFSSGKITVADVHGMLGTAGEERLTTLLNCLVARNAAGALAELDAAMNGGVDAGLLIEQLFGTLRDCMVAAVGCTRDNFLYTSPSGAEHIASVGKQLGLNTLLAIMQILDETLSRMQYSTQSRILAELALVRICQLEDLDELSDIIAQFRAGGPIEVTVHNVGGAPAIAATPAVSAAAIPAMPPSSTAANTAAAVKKNSEPAVNAAFSAAETPSGSSQAAHPAAMSLTPASVLTVWTTALSQMSGMVVEQAKQFDSVSFLPPNRLVVRFKPQYAIFKKMCEQPEQAARFEAALAEAAGQAVRVEFAVTAEAPSESAATTKKFVSPAQRRLEVLQDPFMQKAVELFDAQILDINDPPPKE